MKYIIGNWKSNKTLDETVEWFKQFKQVYQPVDGVEVVVALPYPYVFEIAKLKNEIKLMNVKLAVQDISAYPLGAYTGAVAAVMVKEWVDWVIVGHSERRRYFHETDQEVANKVARVIDANLKVILCVDRAYAKSQRAAISEVLDNVIVAYEPLEAIGTGNPEDPKTVEEAIGEIKAIYDEQPILYGGSVNADNAKAYLEVRGVDGLLVGGSSLEAAGFNQIIKAV